MSLGLRSVREGWQSWRRLRLDEETFLVCGIDGDFGCDFSCRYAHCHFGIRLSVEGEGSEVLIFQDVYRESWRSWVFRLKKLELRLDEEGE